VHGLSQQAPGGGRGEDHRVGAALLEQVDVLGLARRSHDPGLGVELSRRERDEGGRSASTDGGADQDDQEHDPRGRHQQVVASRMSSRRHGLASAAGRFTVGPLSATRGP